MSRPNPHTRLARAQRKRARDLAAAGIKTKPQKVAGLPEAIMLAGLDCPDENCKTPLELAFPSPANPLVLVTKCGGCGKDWPIKPVGADITAQG